MSGALIFGPPSKGWPNFSVSDPQTEVVKPSLRLYIAGPMRNHPFCNFPAFDRARDWLLREGHRPVSPADHDREMGFDPMTCSTCNPFELSQAKFDFAAAMRWDLGIIIDPKTDGIVLLPGWDYSTGVEYERSANRAVGGREFDLIFNDDGAIIGMEER